jgi:hypothetical protein
MKNEYQCLDLVVRKFSNAPSPHLHSAPNVSPANPPLPNLDMDQEDAVVVPNAQSARMSLAFVLMIIYIVGLMMSVRPPGDSFDSEPSK